MDLDEEEYSTDESGSDGYGFWLAGDDVTYYRFVEIATCFQCRRFGEIGGEFFRLRNSIKWNRKIEFSLIWIAIEMTVEGIGNFFDLTDDFFVTFLIH